ncbi:stalk domain-containing protein [Gottschalkia acidurici]
MEPFIYNETTYLPVRTVDEAMKKKVDWDNKSKTVYIRKYQKK